MGYLIYPSPIQPQNPGAYKPCQPLCLELIQTWYCQKVQWLHHSIFFLDRIQSN